MQNIADNFAGDLVRLPTLKVGQTCIFAGQCPLSGANIQALVSVCNKRIAFEKE